MEKILDIAMCVAVVNLLIVLVIGMFVSYCRFMDIY